jgi:predicted nucleic acid-binding protein
MKDRVFLDTNIFIYALTEPKEKNKEEDLRKRAISLKLLAKLFNEKNIVISIQVLNELHFNMLRKFKLDDELVINSIEENVFAIALVENLTVQTYTKASQIRKKYNISYWDSLVVASALESGCSTLYSEDMHNNLVIENSLTIINPF